MTEHVTEISSNFNSSTGTDEFDAFCSCGWDTTRGARILTQEDAGLAAQSHVDTKLALQEPLTAAIANVFKAHSDFVSMKDLGKLKCTCREWEVRGHPAGLEVAAEQWLLHFAEKMREAVAYCLSDQLLAQNKELQASLGQMLRGERGNVRP